MHEQETALIRALVPVAWADGDFAKKEQEMLDAFLEAYGATDAEKAELREYAKEKRTLEDIELNNLSASDRRVLLQHAVLLSFADGQQSPAESEFLAADRGARGDPRPRGARQAPPRARRRGQGRHHRGRGARAQAPEFAVVYALEDAPDALASRSISLRSDSGLKGFS